MTISDFKCVSHEIERRDHIFIHLTFVYTYRAINLRIFQYMLYIVHSALFSLGTSSMAKLDCCYAVPLSKSLGTTTFTI